MTILPLRRIYIERQVQPKMLSFVSAEDVVGLFDMFVISPLAAQSLADTLPLFGSDRYFDHINVSQRHCHS